MALLSRVFNRIGDVLHKPRESKLLSQRYQLKEQKRRKLSRKTGLKKNFDAEHIVLKRHLIRLFNNGQNSIEQNQQIEELCLNLLSSSAAEVMGHKAIARKAVQKHQDVETNLALIKLASLRLEMVENDSEISRIDADIREIDTSLSRLRKVS